MGEGYMVKIVRMKKLVCLSALTQVTKPFLLGIYKSFVNLYTRIGVIPFPACPTLDQMSSTC